MAKKLKSLKNTVLTAVRSHPAMTILWILFVLTPWICFIDVELLSEHSPLTLEAWQWLMNLIWYYCLLFIGLVITGRLKGAILFDAIFSFIIGLANHYVLEFRGRALFPIDLTGWKTAANVAGGYSYMPNAWEWAGIAVFLALLVGLHFLPHQKKRFGGWKGAKWVCLGVGAGWCVYIAVFFFSSMLPSLGIYAQQWKTQGNGFLLNFTVSARYMRVSRPEGYTEDGAKELIASLEEEGYTSDSASGADTAANFIIIMDEAFADLTMFDNLTLTGDPTPFLHSLEENTIQGYLIASVTGGGTASTEFEVLSGNTMAFLPGGTVAYQLYLTDNTPSLAQNAVAMGMRTSAYHPYEASGWNRTNAYQRLGFPSQYYLDEIIGLGDLTMDYGEDELVRCYVSDSADFARLYQLTEKAREEDQNCFIFNVTMQNHSGYTLEWNNLSPSVSLAGDYVGNGYDSSTSQYLALVTATDSALKELIDYYSQVEEPTVILFYGDHQPALKNALYEKIYGKALDQRTPQELIEQFETPFFIWANFDIEEQQDLLVGGSFLGSLASQVAGYPKTGYQKFTDTVYETFDAITPVGYVRKDGTVVLDFADLTEEEQELVLQYQYLQYYNLFGDQEEDKDFYFLRED